MELKRYWEILLRRRWVLIQTVAVILGTALLASFLLTPIYGISSAVLINAESLQPSFFSPNGGSALPEKLGKLSYIEPRNVVDTYMSLATSSSVLCPVIEELNLRDTKGNLIEAKDFIVTVPRFPKLLMRQKKGVRIKRLRAAEVLEITGYSTDREEAARIANSVANSFLTFLSELHRKEVLVGRQTIEEQLRQIEEKKAQAEYAEERYRIKEKVVDLDKQASNVLSELSALEIEKNTVQRNVAGLLTGLTPEHIDVVNSTVKLKVLSEQIDRKNKELNAISKKTTELARLISKTKILRNIYESLENRLEYATIAGAMDITNAVTVQTATKSFSQSSDRYFPKKKLIAVMALLLGTIFGVFLVFLLEYLDDTIKTTEDVQTKFNQPVLGMVPQVKNGFLNGDTAPADNGFYSNFWNLRSNVKMNALHDTHKVLLITSATKGEGKSTISKYLSHTLAESGQRILLVDLNLRRPALHKLFNVSNSAGLSDFLKGKAEMNEIILPTAVEGLYLIPAGIEVATPLKIIDSLNMFKLVQAVKEDYDLIILDTPAIEDGSDAAVISSYSDSILFVLARGCVSQDTQKSAMEIVRKTKTNIVGVVLNTIPPRGLPWLGYFKKKENENGSAWRNE